MKSEVPAVLSLALPHELGSPRIKETVHPSPKVWMHHLELHDPAGVDTEVTRWLSEAYETSCGVELGNGISAWQRIRMD